MKGLHLQVNECIYCGAADPPLTREHVLPRGLGGNDSPVGYTDALVLQKASCKGCQGETQRIEDACLVAMMGPARARLGLRRADRAKCTTTAHVDYQSGHSEDRETEWQDVPGAMVLPSFYEAPIISGAPVPEFPRCDYRFTVVAPAQVLPDDARRVGVSVVASSMSFARMIAKIGLGLAVAGLGVNGYEPLVRELILRGEDKLGLVGGFAGTQREEEDSAKFHKLHLITNNRVPNSFIIAEVRLFAEFNGPTNYVVVGRWL